MPPNTATPPSSMVRSYCHFLALIFTILQELLPAIGIYIPSGPLDARNKLQQRRGKMLHLKVYLKNIFPIPGILYGLLLTVYVLRFTFYL